MKKMIVLLPAMVALANCATITRGTTEAFSVETEPSGAKVTTSLGLMCEPTPCVLPKVSREADFTVTIEKEGYKTGTYNVTHQTSGGGGAGMAGNVLLGGVIGAAIDANNGATQELVPNPLRVTLEVAEPVSAATASSEVDAEIIVESTLEESDAGS